MRMWRWLFGDWHVLEAAALACVVFGAARCRGAGELADEARAGVAARTLAVHSKLTREGQASGFVWGREGDTSYVVTVLMSGLAISPDLPIWIDATRTTVVSRPGTKQQARHGATVVAYDPRTGLTVLAVRGDLPSPIPALTSPTKMGTPVHIATVPRAQRRRSSREQYPVSVTPSRIASFRKWDHMPVLQLDGDVPAGGEGGPVVAPTGHVAGIAYGRVENSLISIAFPVETTRQFLSGMPYIVGIHQAGRSVDIRVALLDLRKTVTSCTIHLLDKGKVATPAPDANGVWQLLATGTTPFTAKVDWPTIAWSAKRQDMKVPAGEYWVQAQTILADGRRLVSPPASVNLNAATPSSSQSPARPTRPKPNPAASADRVRVLPNADMKKDVFLRGPNAAKSPTLSIARTSTRRIGDFDFISFALLATGNRLKLNERGRPMRQQDLASIHGVAWEPSGETVYLLSKSKVRYRHSEITRIRRPGDECTARAAARGQVVQIEWTRWGLLAVLADRGVYLLDTETLEIKKRLPVPAISAICVASMGDYAIAVGRDRYLSERDIGSDSRPVAALHVLNLETWRVERVYRGETEPLPAVAKGALPMDTRFSDVIGLSDDGGWLYVKPEANRRGPALWCVPFRNGTLDVSAVVTPTMVATGYSPVPEQPQMLVQCFPLPAGLGGGGAAPRAMRVALYDPTQPDAKGRRFAAILGAASTDHIFTLDDKQHMFRCLDRKGLAKMAIALPELGPAGAGRLRLFPAPKGRSVLFAWDGLWYLLEPHREDSLPPTAKELPLIAGSAKDEPAKPLATARGAGHGREWETYTVPGLGSTVRQAVAPDGDAVYLADQKRGVVHRLLLGQRVETAMVDERGSFRAMALNRQGLLTLVGVDGGKMCELRLRDAETLALRQQWPLTATAHAVFSRPDTDLAVTVTTAPRGLQAATASQATVYDCKTGKPLGAQVPLALEAGPTTVALGPGGSQLFAVQQGRVTRYSLTDGAFVPELASTVVLPNASALAVDDEGRYVGVITANPIQLGWGSYRLPTEPTGQSRPMIVVLTADRLQPVYQADAAKGTSFVFDRNGAQLVTNTMARCLPDGRTLGGGVSPGALSRGADGWFVHTERGQLSRTRFTTVLVPAREWSQR